MDKETGRLFFIMMFALALWCVGLQMSEEALAQEQRQAVRLSFVPRGHDKIFAESGALAATLHGGANWVRALRLGGDAWAIELDGNSGHLNLDPFERRDSIGSGAIADTCITFNGDSSYVDFGTDAFLPMGNEPRTITGRFRYYMSYEGADSSQASQCILRYGAWLPNGHFYIKIIDQITHIIPSVADTSFCILSHTNNLYGKRKVEKGVWYDFRVEMTETTLKTYLNDTLDIDTVHTFNTVPCDTFYVGQWAAGHRMYKGQIADLKILNGSGDCVFYAPMSEGSGVTAYDVSGNGHHGTLYNFLPPGPAVDSAWAHGAEGGDNYNRSYGYDTVGTQVVLNTSFEDGAPGDPPLPKDWGNNGLESGEGMLDSTYVLTGSYSYHINANADNEGIFQNLFPRLVYGSKYSVSVWLKRVSGTAGISISSWDGIEYSNNQSSGYENYEEVVSTFIWKGWGQADLHLKAVGGTAEFYIDNISVRCIDRVPARTDKPVYAANGNYAGNPAYKWQSTTLLRNLADDQAGAISCWIKSPTAGSDSGTVLCIGDTDGDTFLRLRVVAGKLAAECVSSGTSKWSAITDNAVVENGAWYSVTLNHDGVSPRLWAGSATGTPGIIAQTLTGGDQTAWFSDLGGLDNGRAGCSRFDGNTTDFWSGQLAKLEIHSRALMAGEINN
ncbi:MAG: LamG-like jellyroll fold domain-containing protein [Gemmatimonadota bacterium]|nr:LamG-like jellyroll fold domain-containing protein [Gemmatimonadota bacterium]